MRKKLIIFTAVLALAIAVLPTGKIAVSAEATELYLGGMPAGFRIDNRGAMVIGVNDVITSNGLYSPSREAGIDSGDILLALDGRNVNSAADISTALADYDGNGVTATIERNGEIIIKILYPAKDLSGQYRLGMFVRDDVSGIGTITFIKDDLSFGALGHPIVEGENQRLVKINSGEVYSCNVIGVNRGERGKAGEIRGYFIEDAPIGTVDENLPEGIFGKITDKQFVSELKKLTVGTAKPGKASIFTTVEGTKPVEYEISIVKVDALAAGNKNLVIKITDDKLLEKTGGILQGMSGSPIVQGGKIVGAVTHVFINDPTRGFGISIENMLK